jgi:hypothetical protein
MSRYLRKKLDFCILIGTNEYRRPIKRGVYLIKFLRQKNTITESNIDMNLHGLIWNI